MFSFLTKPKDVAPTVDGPSLFNRQTVASEDAPVDLVVFVIHGIGFNDTDEEKWKVELSTSIRNALLTHYWDQDPMKVQIRVISWKDVVEDASALHNKLNTGRGGMRQVLHHYAGDVLYFMTPHVGDKIVTTVAERLQVEIASCRSDPKTASSKMVVFAHSLGSVISFEALTGYRARPGGDAQITGRVKTEPLVPLGSVDALFLLGSPLGGFLTLHSDALGSPLELDPRLPVLNVYHPEDPIAFRLEPLYRIESLVDENALSPSPVALPVASLPARGHPIERYRDSLAATLETSDPRDKVWLSTLKKGLGAAQKAMQQPTVEPTASQAVTSTEPPQGTAYPALAPPAAVTVDPPPLPSGGSGMQLLNLVVGAVQNQVEKMEKKAVVQAESSINYRQNNVDVSCMFGDQPYVKHAYGGRIDFSLQDNSLSSWVPHVQTLTAHNAYFSNPDVALFLLNVVKPLDFSHIVPTDAEIHSKPFPAAVKLHMAQQAALRKNKF